MRGPTLGSTSLADFEALLTTSEQKLELLGGKVVVLARESVAHGMLNSRLHNIIVNATQLPCQAFTSDVAVRVAERNSYVFPDVSRTCEKPDVSATCLVAPDLVVEVISPDSKARDCGEKLDAYQSLPSVMEYLLVDSRRVWVCLFRRMAGGVWTETTYGIGETVDLRAVGATIDVAKLYAGTGRVLST